MQVDNLNIVDGTVIAWHRGTMTIAVIDPTTGPVVFHKATGCEDDRLVVPFIKTQEDFYGFASVVSILFNMIVKFPEPHLASFSRCVPVSPSRCEDVLPSHSLLDQ